MAQVVGFDRHRYDVSHFNTAMHDAQKELMEAADQYASGDQTLEVSQLCERIPNHFGSFNRGIPAYAYPPGWPADSLNEFNGVMIAADYWEERGDTRRANELRIRAQCMLTLEDILSEAVCSLEKDDLQSAESVICEMVATMKDCHMIRVPYGVHLS